MSGSDRFKFWLVLLGLIGAAVYSFWYAFRSWRENRTVEDTPTSRVRSAAQGYVQLTGRGLMPPDKNNQGPLTRIPCTWWRYKIEERRSSGRSRSWTTVQSDTSAVPFILDDGTGQCLIDPRGAEVFPSATDVWYGNSEWPEVRIPDGEGFLGKLADLLLAGGRYRYTEYRLQLRETVYALGAYRSLGGVEHRKIRIAPWRSCCANGSMIKRPCSSGSTRTTTASWRRDEWDRARAAARQQVVGSMAGAEAANARLQRSVETGGRTRLSIVGLGWRSAGETLAPQSDCRSRRMRGLERRRRLDGGAPLIESRSEQPTFESGFPARLRSDRGGPCPAGARTDAWLKIAPGSRN